MKTKVCTKCKKEKPIVEFHRNRFEKSGLQSWCKECSNKRTREWRKKNKKRYEKCYSESIKKYWKINATSEMHERRKIRQLSNNMLRSGKIEKQPCFLCGENESEMHHINYDYPDKVIWLCKKHHIKVHKQINGYKRIINTKRNM